MIAKPKQVMAKQEAFVPAWIVVLADDKDEFEWILEDVLTLRRLRAQILTQAQRLREDSRNQQGSSDLASANPRKRDHLAGCHRIYLPQDISLYG